MDKLIQDLEKVIQEHKNSKINKPKEEYIPKFPQFVKHSRRLECIAQELFTFVQNMSTRIWEFDLSKSQIQTIYLDSIIKYIKEFLFLSDKEKDLLLRTFSSYFLLQISILKANTPLKYYTPVREDYLLPERLIRTDLYDSLADFLGYFRLNLLVFEKEELERGEFIE